MSLKSHMTIQLQINKLEKNIFEIPLFFYKTKEFLFCKI